MNKTPIEWTYWSVNPFKLRMPDGTLINACVHKSSGCKNCYAEGIVRRWWKKEWGEFPGYTAALLKLGTPVLVEDELKAVLRLSDRIAKGKANPAENKVFWNDMTDEFLDVWPDEFIDKCFAVRALTPNLIHQVLTKRIERAREYLKSLSRNKCRGYWFGEIGYLVDVAVSSGITTKEDAHERLETWRRKHRPDLPDEPQSIGDTVAYKPKWPLEYIHLGVSVEDQKTADERIPKLLQTPAAVRWISAEPLLGPIDLPQAGLEIRIRDLDEPDEVNLDWVVTGAESGPGARPMAQEWVRGLKNQCAAAGVPFFYKQDAINGKKIPTPELDGQTWMQFPNQKQQFTQR